MLAKLELYARSPALNLAVAERRAPRSAHSPRERDHDHPAGARGAQRGGRRVGGGARRVDIVDEHDGRRNPRGGDPERTAHVATALRARERGLSRNRPSALEQARDGQAPALAESVCEVARGLVPALDAAIAVRRDIGDDVGRRAGHPLQGELGGNRSEAAEPALLPGPHGCACRARVGNRSVCGVEREPASGAFGATAHGPRRRRAAASARRRADLPQRALAGVAEQRARRAARGAPGRKQELVEPRRSRYGESPNVSVTTSNSDRNG